MSKEVSIALLLSLAAGLSTALGSGIVLAAKRMGTKLLSCSLGFSAGVMILVSISDLIPEALELLVSSAGETGGYGMLFASLAMGFLIAALINAVIPKEEKRRISSEGKNKVPAKKMMRIGLVSAVAITLHNFPEGIATFMAGYHSLALGLPVALAVAIHNIPEGIAVCIPVYYGTGSKKKAFFYSLASGLSEPLGALLAYAVLAPFLSNMLLGVIFSAVSGIMLYLSFDELLPASLEYGHKALSVAGVLSGICVMLLGLYLSKG